NYKTLRRYKFLKRILKEMGINEKRLRLEWISASEGEKLQRVVKEFVEEIKKLGPISNDDAFKKVLTSTKGGKK
ncbi:MAG: hydrogenase iron-sulfur subunit, partial [candidate division WOR-3 bacterium]